MYCRAKCSKCSMKCGAGEPVAGKDRLTFRLAHRDMPDQSLGREKYLFQSMALHVLAYNLTRVMNIIGIKPLMAAIRA